MNVKKRYIIFVALRDFLDYHNSDHNLNDAKDIMDIYSDIKDAALDPADAALLLDIDDTLFGQFINWGAYDRLDEDQSEIINNVSFEEYCLYFQELGGPDEDPDKEQPDYHILNEDIAVGAAALRHLVKKAMVERKKVLNKGIMKDPSTKWMLEQLDPKLEQGTTSFADLVKEVVQDSNHDDMIGHQEDSFTFDNEIA